MTKKRTINAFTPKRLSLLPFIITAVFHSCYRRVSHKSEEEKPLAMSHKVKTKLTMDGTTARKKIQHPRD
jgi:hypothetical protein